MDVRSYRGPNLCVRPVDQRLEEEFSLLMTATQASQRRALQKQLDKLGTNISVPLGGAPLKPEELLQKLREWSPRP